MSHVKKMFLLAILGMCAIGSPALDLTLPSALSVAPKSTISLFEWVCYRCYILTVRICVMIKGELF